MCGDDEERRGQDVCLVADGDLAFLHGLEQRALHLGCGAVDFVGQKQVREDRAEVRGEFIRPLIEHLRTEDVRRQKVDGKLHAAKLEINRLGDRLYQQSLGQAGHALQ